jgi:large subunit ribosomal protein L24
MMARQTDKGKSMRIKRGDTVEVISGNDRGVRGEVLRVHSKKRRVVVTQVNVVSKHQRPMQAGRGQAQAGIIQFEAPVDVSNVMLVCPNCDEATRVGARRDGGRRIRLCKKCGEEID